MGFSRLYAGIDFTKTRVFGNPWNFRIMHFNWRFGKSQLFLRIDDGSFVFQDQTGGVYRVDLNGKLIWSAARFPPFCQGGICQKQSIGRGQNHGSFLKHGFVMFLVSCCHRWPSLSLLNGTIPVPLNWITVISHLVVFQLYLDIFSKKQLYIIGMIGILRDPVATSQYHELVRSYTKCN